MMEEKLLDKLAKARTEIATAVGTLKAVEEMLTAEMEDAKLLLAEWLREAINRLENLLKEDEP